LCLFVAQKKESGKYGQYGCKYMTQKKQGRFCSWPHSSTSSSAFRTGKKKMRDLPKLLHFLGTSADSMNWKHLSIGEKWRWVSRARGLESSGCLEESKKRRTQWLEMQFMQLKTSEHWREMKMGFKGSGFSV
jgi:hypothetical protein